MTLQRSAELERLTTRLYEALSTGDIGLIERAHSRDDALVTIGTDPNEWWQGYESVIQVYRAQLEQLGHDLRVVGTAPRAYVEGAVGWVADRAKFVVGGREIPFRLTVVFHREDSEWKIVQLHSSIGVANAEGFGRELTT